VVQQMPPGKLTPYARNTKAHSPDQIALVAKQIYSAGFMVPIVVDKELVIITGHCRREAALSLNMETVPVIVADHLSEEEARAWRIADNRANEAPWNLDMLRFELHGLDQLGVELRDVGFPQDQIGNFLETGLLPDTAFDPRVLGTEFAGPFGEAPSLGQLLKEGADTFSCTLVFKKEHKDAIEAAGREKLVAIILQSLGLEQ
jgi:hypothetical protein